ncbi:MAG: NAD(P)/FAD-dependent oxidoreductase [Thermoanaerobaculia bacterium]
MKTVRADVAVIGAGPGGSTAASLLARRGRDVVLIDRERFPRDKLCGEFLSYDSLPILDRMGLTGSIDALGAVKIRRCRIVGTETGYEIELPHPARGISRMALDAMLTADALKEGAQDLTGWAAETIEPGDPYRIVIVNRDREKLRVEARTVIGAWGRWARFDRQFAREFVTDRRNRHFGFKRHFRSEHGAGDTILLYPYRNGYLGASGVESGATNICGIVHASRIRGLRGGWNTFISGLSEESEPLRELFASHTPEQDQFLSSDPVIFRPKAPVVAGILLVGDAAGMIDPLTGNGMTMAIQSAVIAARNTASILDGTASRGEIERSHVHEFRGFFASRLRWSRRAAFLLSRPSLLNAALKTLGSTRIGETFLHRTRARLDDVERLADGWFGER